MDPPWGKNGNRNDWTPGGCRVMIEFLHIRKNLPPGKG
jgi:hypothetical protein